jgi:hypothetical protein
VVEDIVAVEDIVVVAEVAVEVPAAGDNSKIKM